MKMWSYKAITEQTEREIRRLVEEDAKLDDFTVRLRKTWAWGVFMFWNNLTMGWQKEGDSERLEALTKPYCCERDSETPIITDK